MRLLKKLFLCAAFLLIALPVHGAGNGASLEEIVDGLQGRYGEMKTLEAEFLQETYTLALEETEEASGKVAFEKPGRMRWDYDNGEKIISDGRLIWVYQPDLNQLIESSVSDQARNPALDLLSGMGTLKENFEAKLMDATGENYRLELIPKEGLTGLKNLFIEVSCDFVLVKTVLADPFGNETTVSFHDMKPGASFSKDFFSKSSIKGVRVVRP